MHEYFSGDSASHAAHFACSHCGSTLWVSNQTEPPFSMFQESLPAKRCISHSAPDTRQHKHIIYNSFGIREG